MQKSNDFFSVLLKHQTTLLVLLLIIVAAVPRMYRLGELSFYGDEETTAFPSREVAQGKAPTMPGGMPYHRSLPHTWMNAMSANFFGIEKEFSYRLPSALLGLLTIPLIFLMTKPWLGTSIAFLAALLLSVSEWHIIFSRMGRMYAPFLFFYIACAYSLLHWAQKDSPKNLIIAIVTFSLAAIFHNLGVLAAFIPLVALNIRGFATTSQIKLIAFAVIGGIGAYFYGQYFVAGPYHEWKNMQGIAVISANNSNPLLNLVPEHFLLLIAGVVGAIPGLWLARVSGFTDNEHGKEFRIVTRYALTIITGWFAGTGLLYGAALSMLLLLLLHNESAIAYVRKCWQPLLALALLGATASLSQILELGVIAGIKAAVSYPFPYWITIADISPGITLLFVASLIYLALDKKSVQRNNILVLSIIGLYPFIIIGLASQWAPARYLLQAYPFMLIISAVAIINFIAARTTIHKNTVAIISTAFVLSGILGGHGIVSAYNVATLQHGTRFNEAALIFPVYPDHKSPGEYVASRLEPDDLVIAEDTLEQAWYVGRVDYWLRDYTVESEFFYQSEDGNLHDIYINSIAATPEILSALLTEDSHRVWLITSAETFYNREGYLSASQLEWLSAVESNFPPVFTGRDKITKVYCLHCNEHDK